MNMNNNVKKVRLFSLTKMAFLEMHGVSAESFEREEGKNSSAGVYLDSPEFRAGLKAHAEDEYFQKFLSCAALIKASMKTSDVVPRRAIKEEK